jgi:amino-acid N-acetyltransferase
MTTLFRKATAVDGPAIRVLLEDANLPTESLGGTLTSFFVAEHDGMIIGVAGFEYYGNDALLRSVAIQPRLRNAGIGSALVDWMLTEAKKSQIRRIVLLTETAKNFFEKKGFTVVPRSAIQNTAMTRSSEFVTACPVSATTMMLDLT